MPLDPIEPPTDRDWYEELIKLTKEGNQTQREILGELKNLLSAIQATNRALEGKKY